MEEEKQNKKGSKHALKKAPRSNKQFSEGNTSITKSTGNDKQKFGNGLNFSEIRNDSKEAQKIKDLKGKIGLMEQKYKNINGLIDPN